MGKAEAGGARLKVKSKPKKKSRIKRALLFLAVIAVAAVGLLFLTDNRHFEVTRYTMGSDKVEHGFRIALLTDLHEQEYGEGNSELVQAIADYQTDLIIMAGDMVNSDDADVDVLLELCDALNPVAPICFVPGNHEETLMFGSGDDNVPVYEYLAQRGIDTMYGGWLKNLTINGDTVTVGAFSCSDLALKQMDSAQLAQLNAARKEFEKSGGFRIAVSHYPTTFYEYLYDVDADLAVAGHFHGGQIRLPYLGGLYHADGGLFPKYSGGKYYLDRAVLIVSRGLGGHEIIPRVNNRPELVLIEVAPFQTGSGG